MSLHSRDVLKLLKAGFTIIRADNINLKIKCKSYNNRTPEWTMGIFFLALDEFKPDD